MLFEMSTKVIGREDLITISVLEPVKRTEVLDPIKQSVFNDYEVTVIAMSGDQELHRVNPLNNAVD